MMRCPGCGSELALDQSFCARCGAPAPPPSDSFARARRRFDALRTRYQSGELDAAQFQVEREALTVQDTDGGHWTPAEAGQWYWYDGSAWVLRTPPMVSGRGGQAPVAGDGPTRRPTWLAIGGAVVTVICLALAAYALWRPGARSPAGPNSATLGAVRRQTGWPTPTQARPPTQPPPTVTARPSPTVSMAQQPTEPLVPAYVQAALPGAVVLYEDDFQDPSSGWETTPNEWASYSYHDGEYLLEVLQDDASAWVGAPAGTFDDFWVEVDVRQVSGTQSQDFGLVFRREGNAGFYYLAITELTELGQYVLFLRDEGRFGLVQGRKWTRSDAFHGPGQGNRLAVACIGERITLYVNGVELVTLEDATFSRGGVGFAASRDPGSEPLKVAFDNIRLYGLPGPAAEPSAQAPAPASLPADQQAVYSDFGPPHSFTVIAFDSADGSVVRHETWSYHDTGSTFVFIDGAYQYWEEAEVVPGNLIKTPYDPRQFTLGTTLEQVKAIAPGQTWERMDWIDVALEGSQIYVTNQLFVAFDENGLVLVEGLAILPEGGE